MWAAVRVPEMKTLHVACDDLEGQHGKIMSILGGRRQTYIKILEFQDVNKCYDSTDLRQFCHGKIAEMPPRGGGGWIWAYTLRKIVFCRLFLVFNAFFAHGMVLHPRIQFLDVWIATMTPDLSAEYGFKRLGKPTMHGTRLSFWV